jgi:hypothetical protein
MDRLIDIWSTYTDWIQFFFHSNGIWTTVWSILVLVWAISFLIFLPLHRLSLKKEKKAKQDLVNSLMTKLLSMPVATFRIEYQSYLNQMMHYAMFHDETKVSKSVSRLVTQLEGFGMMNLHMLVRYCIQNWVIDGFRDDMGTQNVLLALISGAADMEMVS